MLEINYRGILFTTCLFVGSYFVGTSLGNHAIEGHKKDRLVRESKLKPTEKIVYGSIFEQIEIATLLSVENYQEDGDLLFKGSNYWIFTFDNGRKVKVTHPESIVVGEKYKIFRSKRDRKSFIVREN